MSSPKTMEELSLQSRAKGHTYLEKLGKLKLWTRLGGIQALGKHHERTAVNLAAEDAAVRRALFGKQASETPEVSDDMGHTVLGDMNYPTPVVVNYPPAPPPQNGGGFRSALAVAALGASLVGIPGAGLIGYLLNQKQPTQEKNETGIDTSVKVGLGKIGDLMKGQ